MYPRVSELANMAYGCAAKIMETKTKGDTPPVRLRSKRWRAKGVTMIGRYTWMSTFGRVLWDHIEVVDDVTYIWPNLVHEMTHALRRRKGKPSSEAAAEAAEGVANKKCGGRTLDAALARFAR